MSVRAGSGSPAVEFHVTLGEITCHTHTLPLVLFAPTARCNISCDSWRFDGAGYLTLREIRIAPH